MACSASAEMLAGLDEWLDAERQRWGIPGMAVAVVHNDELVFARGFGTTRLEHGRPVDADTQFGIASLTKAMTATSLGLLVDEGLLDWTDRVVDHLPEFALSDPWVTANVTVRDLLSHQVGVGRLFGNRLTFMPAASRDQFMRHLRHHDFEQPFRQGYVYSNSMYTVAGAILEVLSDETWEHFVESRLFAPLAMNRSNTSIHRLDDNAAWPHQEIRGQLVEVPRRDWGYAGPAAAVNASVNDLAQWMRLNLGDRGVLDGKRLVSDKTISAIHSPVNLTGFDDAELSVNAYAMGWGLGRYQGLHVMRHGGATDGFNTQVWLVPELALGIVMSANRFTELRDPVMRRIVDLVAGHEPFDWAGQQFQDELNDRELARAAREAVHAKRQPDSPPRHHRTAYLGSYHHPLYDQVEVLETDSGLALRFWQDDSQTADLEHWHFDTFLATWRNPAQREKFVWFVMGEDGLPHELRVRFTLRPESLEEGIYPADYTRTVHFKRQPAGY